MAKMKTKAMKEKVLDGVCGMKEEKGKAVED